MPDTLLITLHADELESITQTIIVLELLGEDLARIVLNGPLTETQQTYTKLALQKIDALLDGHRGGREHLLREAARLRHASQES